jgi:hypothetical protein
MDDKTTHTHTDRTRRVRFVSTATVVGMVAVAGCGSSDSSSRANGRTTTGERVATVVAPRTARPAAAAYDPKIDPADFTHEITNPYYTLRPGSVRVTKGTKDGSPQTHTTTVTSKTKTIAGVRCLVVRDIVTSNGALVEKVRDWYAQDRKGNVWYFGEATADYEKGVVVTTKGSWETGVDGAKPGIVMPAEPKPGPAFYTEFRPGVAEDKAQVLRLDDAIRVPYGSFKKVIVIRDSNPLDPQLVSHKWYAKGVGLLKTTRVGSSHKEYADLIKLTR